MVLGNCRAFWGGSGAFWDTGVALRYWRVFWGGLGAFKGGFGVFWETRGGFEVLESILGRSWGILR